MPGEILAIVGAALAGGLVPLFIQRSERLLHRFVSVATGLFLGMVCLHLLPEVARDARGPGAWGLVALGVVGLFVLEKLVLTGRRRRDPHAAVGWASFLGLTIHALATGFGLAASAGHASLQVPVFLSILTHKVAEGFSLATVFRLGALSRQRIGLLVFLFALATPAGLLAGAWMLEDVGESSAHLFTALAAGTFLYVALGDLLPEVFHERADTARKLLLLGAGFGASALLHLAGA